VAQELIELYRHKLDEPRRAMPELARIAQLVPGTPQAEAATRELAELRAGMGGSRATPCPDDAGGEGGRPRRC